MTTTQLSYFIAAAESMSFTSAAQRMFTSQPTLSRQIAMLEEELNTQLFDRNNNVLRLTPAGGYFLERARYLLEQIQETTQQLGTFRPGPPLRLHLGLLEDQQLMPQISRVLTDMMADPTITIEITRGSHNDLMDRMSQGQIDLCQVLLFDGAPLDVLDAQPVEKEPMFLAMKKGLLPVTKEEITRSEMMAMLGDCPVIAAAPRSFPGQILPFLPETWRDRLRYVASLSVISLYVTGGLGVSVVNPNNIITLYPDVQLVRITDFPPVTQGVIWRRDNKNPLREELLDRLREASALSPAGG